MGLFDSQKVVKKTFADQLADVKSVFKKAFEDASNVVSQCESHIQKRKTDIQEIEADINTTKKVQDEASAFMSKLKDLA